MKRNVYNKALKALKQMVMASEGRIGRTTDDIIKNTYLPVDRGRTQRLAVVDENNIHHITNTACSAGLLYIPISRYITGKMGVKAISVLTMNNMAPLNLGDGLKLKFADWFINKSPYSVCISTNSPKNAIEHGIILDANYPSNLVVGAIISWRRLWEYTSAVSSWEVLVDAGMNPSAAFILSHKVLADRSGLGDTNLNGHCAFPGRSISKEMVINFTKGNLVVINDTYTNELNYSKIDLSWGSVSNDWSPLDISGAMVTDKLEDSKVPNPFERSLKLNKKANAGYKVLLDSLVKYINSLVEGNDNA